MREDQYRRLQDLEEKLTDEVLREADPDTWTAPGIQAKDLTQQERGDRYWCKKNAVATISLAIRIGSLIGMVQRNGPTGGADPEEEGENPMDAEIREAEAEAKKLLAKMQKAGRVRSGT